MAITAQFVLLASQFVLFFMFEYFQEDGRKILEMSTKEDEDSVMAVKLESCEVLLQHRVEQKFKTKKVFLAKS